MEEEKNLLKGIGEKNREIVTKVNSQYGGIPKTNRSVVQGQLADEKRIQKLTMENKHLTDQLKNINLKIDTFVKEHLKQSKIISLYILN